MPAPVKHIKSATLFQRVEPELTDSLKEVARKLDTDSSKLIRAILWHYVDLLNPDSNSFDNNVNKNIEALIS